MDQTKIEELLQMIGGAFYDYAQGEAVHQQCQAIYDWMQQNAPEHLKN